MKYSLIIYQTAEAFSVRENPDKAAAYTGGWVNYATALNEAGILVAAVGLEGPEAATTLRFDGGAHRVEDGPFADTKEQLGGVFIIDTPDLDAAMKWAARAPLTYGGSVEIQAIRHATNL